MKVVMYAPDKLYGFCEGPEGRVFFHMESFVAGRWPGVVHPPPPILGEDVEVDCPPLDGSGSRAPRATRVQRINQPVLLTGVVESFNSQRGWGFARGSDEVAYYLHRSEVEGGRLPVEGQQIYFYGGFKNQRPRACHVQIGTPQG